MFNIIDYIIIWDKEKNNILYEKRNISFEIICNYIKQWHPYKIVEHQNKKDYAHQYLLIVSYQEYPYVIPFQFITPWTIQLITIFPDRRYKKI